MVRVDWHGSTEVALAYGHADRAYGIANTADTQFGTASATKGLTALTVMALVEQGVLDLATTARSLLDEDLPEIADDVTVEHLLAHRSGIGDYFDEDVFDDITEYAMPVPVHQLSTPEDYLAVLAGHPTVFPAGERFAYNNGGYVVLALLVERAGGARLPRAGASPRARAGRHGRHRVPAVRRVARAAPRAGTWPASGLRTNVLHLPGGRRRRRRRVLDRGRPAPPLAGPAFRADRLPGRRRSS